METTKISILPASTTSGLVFIFVLMLLLQYAIKFGNAVGLLYQSPPPPYFKTANCCENMIPEIEKKKINNETFKPISKSTLLNEIEKGIKFCL